MTEIRNTVLTTLSGKADRVTFTRGRRRISFALKDIERMSDEEFSDKLTAFANSQINPWRPTWWRRITQF